MFVAESSHRDARKVSVSEPSVTSQQRRMALPLNTEEEMGIEAIDAEILMENVRQSTAKFSFEPYYAAARRNLMDKRMAFDNDTRIDMMQALQLMRKRLPSPFISFYCSFIHNFLETSKFYYLIK